LSHPVYQPLIISREVGMETNILIAIIVVLVTINAIALLVRFSAREKTGKETPEGKSTPRYIFSDRPSASQHSPKIELRK
jgi:hypothetical protein